MSTPMRTTDVLTTERLLLRPWLIDDAQAALEIYVPGYARAAATVRKDGMHWVGETTKYFGVELQPLGANTSAEKNARATHRRPC